MNQLNNGVSRRSLLKAAGIGGVSLASATLLAGCSVGLNKPATPTKTKGAPAGVKGPRTGKELVIYMNAGHIYKTYTDLFARFEKEHNVKVTVNPQQWPDLQTKLTADFLSGDVPDLVEENGSWWSVRWGTAGNILALDDYIAKDGKSTGFPNDFVKSAVEVRQAAGNTYAIPLHLTCNGLIFYNKEMLDKASVSAPKTWDEFTEACKALTAGGVYGAALNQDASYSLPWLLQSGATYYSPSSKEFLTPKALASKTYTLQQDMVYKYKSSPSPVASVSYSGPQKLFSAKQSAMILSGPWDLSPIKTGSPDIELGLAAPLSGKKQAATLAGSGMMIPAKSQNADLAWELIKEMTKLKTELAVTEETGMTMPRLTWAADPKVKNDPLLSVVAKSLPLAVATDKPLAQNNNIASITTAYTTMYQQIVSQQTAVSDAMTKFQSTVASYV
ncbi:ABC transporter substrate-binding protein [Rathayibacter sp. CAU 1779]